MTLIQLYSDWVLNPDVSVEILRGICRAFRVNPQHDFQVALRLGDAILQKAGQDGFASPSPWTPPTGMQMISSTPISRRWKKIT